MKKLFFFIAAVLLFFFLTFPTFAKKPVFEMPSDTPTPTVTLTPTPIIKKTVVLPREQTVDKDYFAAGNTVILSGTVNGDAYLAGGNIIVEGNVTGDLLAAGGSINIRGTVGNNVRIIGGNVNVSGKVGKNLSVAGGNINIADSASIGGNLVTAGGNLTVFGPVGKDIVAASGHVIIASGGRIGGNLTYWSNNAAEVQQGALISGQTTQKPLPKQFNNQMALQQKQIASRAAGGVIGFFVFIKVVSFFSSLFMGLLLLKLFPAFSAGLVKRFNADPWRSLGIGFATMVGLPIFAVALFFTIIGIPLAVAAVIEFMTLIYLSHLVVALVAGRYILEKAGKKSTFGWAFTAGLAVYWFISLIPIIGKITLMVLSLMAAGVLVSNKIALYCQLKEK